MENKYDVLEKRIVSVQEQLKKVNPGHELIGLVEVDDDEVRWTKEFGARYLGMSVFDGLSQYCDDMEKALQPAH